MKGDMIEGDRTVAVTRPEAGFVAADRMQIPGKVGRFRLRAGRVVEFRALCEMRVTLTAMRPAVPAVTGGAALA